MKVLIFAGGNGTRLWPVSRTQSPKQFQNLIDHKTLFQKTVDRMVKRFSLDDLYVVIPDIYVAIVKKEYPLIQEDHLILEPIKWDNLACIGYASFIINQKFPGETIFFVWSDHMMKNEEQFLDVVEAGDAYARLHHKVIKIGAPANFPETNLGYIKYSRKLEEVNTIPVYEYEGHFEKPNIEKAKEYFESGNYLWNMGYMIWPGEMLIESFKKYSPKTYDILKKITNPTFSGNVLEEYKKINKTSIDFEILEKAKKEDFVVISANVGWNDVGDWASLKREMQQNQDESVVLGDVKNVFRAKSKDTIIYGVNPNKIICIVGLDNIAVVDTDDALLICSKDMSAEVKKIVSEVQENDPDKV